MPDVPSVVLSKALTPILGGVGKELSGWLGDQIRLFRWRSAVNIVSRATRFAKKKNIPPAEVPLKFLLPYLERASLEDVRTDSPLPDMWARLLVSAISRFDSRQVIYTEILSKLSSDDAKSIQSFYANMAGDAFVTDTEFDPDLSNFADIESMRGDLPFLCQDFCQRYLKYFSKAGMDVRFFKLKSIDSVVKKELKYLAPRKDFIPICYDLSFLYREENLNGYSAILKHRIASTDTLIALVTLQLLHRFEASAVIASETDSNLKVRVTVSFVCLTSLGFDFMQKCCPSWKKRQKKGRGHRSKAT